MTITIRNQALELPPNCINWDDDASEHEALCATLCICESYWRREAERRWNEHNSGKNPKIDRARLLSSRRCAEADAHAEAFASVHRSILAEKKT